MTVTPISSQSAYKAYGLFDKASAGNDTHTKSDFTQFGSDVFSSPIQTTNEIDKLSGVTSDSTPTSSQSPRPAYTAVANANASIIRGSGLDILT